MKIATVDAILAATETEVVLPALSAALGEEYAVRVRKISSAEHRALMPPSAPDLDNYSDADERAHCLAEWKKSLTPEARTAYDLAVGVALAQMVALAALEPTLTVEQAQRLGEDTSVVAVGILRFSGIMPPAADAAPSGGEDAPVA